MTPVGDLPALFRAALLAELVAAPVTLVVLLFVTAPYGRHLRRGWGPTIGSRLGWLIMEGTAVVAFTATYSSGDHRGELLSLLFLSLWLGHYLYRALLYPFLARVERPMPVAIVGSGVLFNILNGWLNARWVSHLGSYASDEWTSARLLVGICLMALGFAVHVHADAGLRRLRRPGETGYRIPDAGLHRLVASPNYLGEIVEWIGWALATRSPAGLAFALFTIANLAPRAFAHRRWYRATFEAYPEERKALVPWVL